MKKLILSFYLMAICASNALSQSKIPQLAVKDYPNEITIEDKIYTTSVIYSEIKYNFVHIDQIKFDLDSLYKVTMKNVLQSKNDIDYYKTLEKFISSLGDGHTQLLNTHYSWTDYFDYIPCLIKLLDNKLYFTEIRENSDIDPSLVGAEIIEIEGKPVNDYFETELFPYISASTIGHKLYQASIKVMQGTKGTFLKGKAKKTDGSIIDFCIQRNGETTRTKEDKYISLKPQIPQTNNRPSSLNWRNKIAILTINTFDERVIPSLDSLFKIIIDNKAQGLIIDLRRNGGGSTDVAHHLQKYITSADYFLSFGSQTRINNGYGRSQGNYRDEYKDYFLGQAYTTEMPDTINIEKSFPRVKSPVAILIGKFTFSACEDFLVNLYEVPNRPLLIGEETGGSTGAPLVIANLPNNTSARICTLRILFPYSLKPFANKGIVPDITIKETISDYASNVDTALECAISKLNNSQY